VGAGDDGEGLSPTTIANVHGLLLSKVSAQYQPLVLTLVATGLR
jgi:hypothetical protein